MSMERAAVPGMDREAQTERMMRHYGTQVFRMCCAYLHDRALAEDAFQETFLKAYRKLDSFEGDGASEKAWLMRIAINTCKDAYRGGWFRHVDRHADADTLPEVGYEMDTRDRQLADAILSLPRKLKEVVLLHYYQDLTYDETAVALGLSRTTVYNRLVSARRRLKDTLEGWDLDAE